MITNEMLTGQSSEHLTILYGKHLLQPKAAEAFLKLQKAAKNDGFNLQPVSTFRNFARQQMIWNMKFTGKRVILDAKGRPLNITTLKDRELCYSILYWSALPGASRHHWGTDIDIYDPNLLLKKQKLHLELWEYLEGGSQYPLNQWLSDNMIIFGFYRPFNGNKQPGVALEPWHISYKPLASLIEDKITEEVLHKTWQGQYIAGSKWLIPNLTEVCSRFIYS
ncbi:M15 family metallopeptidase [Candidatus Profftia tarda]|uniref:Serine-type D-Ala-D-Ala carboxypeptidase n=1 Tax=Candidatus Profftia tarda TaxID=1177216 RepID=A0A8E4H423_9ENTR|nr:M15 family metallopeptidase [Candidatus Profftia tarda]CAD6511567.1 Serine-type D-Ala-D-Ala carboxypeptidase [Candidatus Profftia tarda]